MKTPETNPPGAAYKLRLTVRDEVADTLLARLSDESTRQALPSFLFVYSEHSYIHQPDDYIDGFSRKDLLFSSYKRKLIDFDRNTFQAGERVELHNRVLRLQANLGHEVAKRVLTPPLFETSQSTDTTLNVYYKIPGSDPIDMGIVDDLEAYFHEDLQNHQPRRVFDELALVTSITALRQFNIRTRERKDDILYS